MLSFVEPPSSESNRYFFSPQLCLGYALKTCSKVLFWTVGMAQVVEHLLCKHKVVSSNPSLTKKKKKRMGVKGAFFSCTSDTEIKL
jgi:hypothetical protein